MFVSVTFILNVDPHCLSLDFYRSSLFRYV